MNDDIEKRKNSRIVFEVDALVKNKKKSIECKLKDLSLHGLFLITDEKLKKKTKLNIRLLIPENSDHPEINIIGKVTRITQNGVGIEFIELDIDSFNLLKKIIEYNQPVISKSELIIKEFLYNNIQE